MASLDLTMEPGLTGRAHYHIRVNGTMMAYCYVRKNGCTAFKMFFNGMSKARRRPKETPMNFMQRTHRAQPGDVAEAEHRICVLRDPVKRCVSLFKNKFIQRNGHLDIFNSYQMVTGTSPEEATFDDFVHSYLARGVNDIDPHAWTQKCHLLPVVYNHVCLMEDIYTMMTPIVGARLANQYFAKPANASVGQAKFDDPAGDMPSSELHRIFSQDGAAPSDAALLTPERVQTILDLYQDEIALIERLNASVGS